jgi:hypothetical protein
VPIAKSGSVGASPAARPETADNLASRLVCATCPGCGHHVAAPFYGGGKQPLATLGWPRTSEEALRMPALPLDFVQCTDCRHVFNRSFDYQQVPYLEMPNLMFNGGTLWSHFLGQIGAEIQRRLPPAPVVVEIGYGNASFLSMLARDCPAGRFIGFDPHGAAAPDGSCLDLRRELFDPGRHVAELRPDLILSRHVLEHLTDPLGFLQHVVLAASCLEQQPWVYLEVPCIDRALETGRIEDFYYEHNSHFTTASFHRMLERSGARLETLGHGYGGEVVYAFVTPGARSDLVRNGLSALDFFAQAGRARQRIAGQLAELHRSGKRVAIWGGTGKSAAFLNAYGVDRERFPMVVDSDAAKAGTYAPGTGQLIRFRDWLVDHPVEVILIPCQWRAADIVHEIRAHGIRYEKILINHGGELIDFEHAEHPYRESQPHLGPAVNGSTGSLSSPWAELRPSL